jgi:hypothetical protein
MDAVGSSETLVSSYKSLKILTDRYNADDGHQQFIRGLYQKLHGLMPQTAGVPSGK